MMPSLSVMMYPSLGLSPFLRERLVQRLLELSAAKFDR